MPDIVIAGATFRGVPQIDIPKEGSGTASFIYEDGTKQITQNGTGIDVSGYAAVDVAVPSSSPVIQSLSVTQNGEYTAPSGVDGYSPVTVNVSGGGGASNFELLYETEQSFSITGTSEQLIFTTPSIDNIFSSDFIIYVRVRDKAGRRDGYFFGTDAYFYNINAETGSTADATGRLTYTFRMNGSTISQTSSPYGVYAQGITADGNVRIYGRYNTTGSRTVNGTYLIKVYKLTLPNGMTPYGN